MNLPRQETTDKVVADKTSPFCMVPSIGHSVQFSSLGPRVRPKTQSVPALERALNILEYLAKSQHGVTHSQLTRKLQLPRSTCHALLRTFERCGYMERDEETGKYRLGFKLYTLANKSLSSVRLRDQAAPALHKLMWETGLTVQLAILVENEAILIERIEPPGSPKVVEWIGKRVGLHCTALGKVLIAHLPEIEANQLVLRQGLLRHNDNTIASTRKLRLACETVRKVGYAIDDEEDVIGIRGIGAPVFDGKGQVVAAISISGPAPRVENVSVLARQVKKTATDLARRLGLVDSEKEGTVNNIPSEDFLECSALTHDGTAANLS